MLLSPHRRSQLQALFQRAKESEEELYNYNEKYIDETVKFFERIALLSGSAIPVSVSLLTFLGAYRKSPVVFLALLHSAWGLLLISMLAALFRNPAKQRYVWACRKAASDRDQLAIAQTTSQNQVKIKNHRTNVETYSKYAKRYDRISLFLGRAACICLFGGLVCVVAFAILNTL